MANVYSIQTIKDTTEHTVIKLTAQFDGSGQESNSFRIVANTLYGALDANNVPLYSALSSSNTAKPYYGLSIDKIWFEANFTGTGHARLYWQSGSAANTKTIIGVTGQGNGEYNGQGNWISIPNVSAGTAGCCSRGWLGVRRSQPWRGPQCNWRSPT